MKISEIPVSGFLMYENCQYLIEDIDAENDIINLIKTDTGDEVSMYFPNIELDKNTYFVSSHDTTCTNSFMLSNDEFYYISESLNYILINEKTSFEEYMSGYYNDVFEIENTEQFEIAMIDPQITHVYKSAELGLRALAR